MEKKLILLPLLFNKALIMCYNKNNNSYLQNSRELGVQTEILQESIEYSHRHRLFSIKIPLYLSSFISFVTICISGKVYRMLGANRASNKTLHAVCKSTKCIVGIRSSVGQYLFPKFV